MRIIEVNEVASQCVSEWTNDMMCVCHTNTNTIVFEFLLKKSMVNKNSKSGRIERKILVRLLYCQIWKTLPLFVVIGSIVSLQVPLRRSLDVLHHRYMVAPVAA